MWKLLISKIAINMTGSKIYGIVPSELAELFSRFTDIRSFPPPVKIPHLTVKPFWHARRRWLSLIPWISHAHIGQWLRDGERR